MTYEVRNDKALDKKEYCFKYICRKFPKFSMKKLKGGIVKGS